MDRTRDCLGPLTLLAVIVFSGCGQNGSHRPSSDRCRLTRAASVAELVALVREYDGHYEGRTSLLEAVSGLHTPQARDALMEVAGDPQLTPPLREQALLIAAKCYGKETARSVFQLYQESVGDDGVLMRGYCAKVLAKLAEEDDWSMNAIVDVFFDQDIHVVQEAARAFLLAPERAVRLVEARLPTIPDSEKKHDLEVTIESIRTRSRPKGAEGQTGGGN